MAYAGMWCLGKKSDNTQVLKKLCMDLSSTLVPPAHKIKLNKLQKSNFTNYRNNFNFDGAVGGYIRIELRQIILVH